MTEITPGATPSPTSLTGVTQQKPDAKDAKPSDSSVKSFEQLLEGGPDDEGTELPRGPFSRPRQGGDGQQSDKPFKQGLAGQKSAEGKYPGGHQGVDGRYPAGQQSTDGRGAVGQNPASNPAGLRGNASVGQPANGTGADAAIAQVGNPSTGVGLAGAQKAPVEDKKLPQDSGVPTQGFDGDEAASGLQQTSQAQPTQPVAAPGGVAPGTDARADDVAKLANTFYKELGARDLNAVKQGGALQFKLGGDAFPGTSVKVSVEAGLTVIDVSSIEPDVQQFLKDSQVELNRFFDAGVSVRVEERDESSEQQQQQDEPEDQEDNE